MSESDCAPFQIVFYLVITVSYDLKLKWRNRCLNVLETPRLVLRRLTSDDAPFILRLLNEPSWHRYIGDKGVRTLADARSYIESGPLEMYQRLGFGLYCVELKESGAPIGLCGLIRRASLENVDLGFALLPEFWAQGYARESSSGVLEYAVRVLGLQKVVAITSQDNFASAKLLERLGFRFERVAQLAVDAAEVNLYARELKDQRH